MRYVSLAAALSALFLAAPAGAAPAPKAKPLFTDTVCESYLFLRPANLNTRVLRQYQPAVQELEKKDRGAARRGLIAAAESLRAAVTAECLKLPNGMTQLSASRIAEIESAFIKVFDFFEVPVAAEEPAAPAL